MLSQEEEEEEEQSEEEEHSDEEEESDGEDEEDYVAQTKAYSEEYEEELKQLEAGRAAWLERLKGDQGKSEGKRGTVPL